MAMQKKSVIGNAAERIRAVDGNKQCSDCSAPSKSSFKRVPVRFSH